MPECFEGGHVHRGAGGRRISRDRTAADRALGDLSGARVPG